MTHSSYHSVIRGCWSNSCSAPQNVSVTEGTLRSWSAESFGSLKVKKQAILARLGGIQ